MHKLCSIFESSYLPFSHVRASCRFGALLLIIPWAYSKALHHDFFNFCLGLYTSRGQESLCTRPQRTSFGLGSVVQPVVCTAGTCFASALALLFEERSEHDISFARGPLLSTIFVELRLCVFITCISSSPEESKRTPSTWGAIGCFDTLSSGSKL